ncbi:MAG: hypothetical protein H6672_01520 [Anaerolineaceae bacterium]|nr:hypothetical protein [Anaerolineaceae bacterium]
MEEPLTILYTANLGGSLERLPRMHTFLRELKNLPPADEPDVLLCAVEPVARRILLLDAGDSCAPEVWHCAATGGRSTLIVLDAMGYDAANVSGILTAESRARLDTNYLGMALVDKSHPWQSEGVMVICGDEKKSSSPATAPQREGRLRIVLSASQTQIVGEGLRTSPTGDVYLLPVAALQVGVIHIAWENHVPVIRAWTTLEMPPSTPPDPTISAAVEFVLAEARRYGTSG